MTIKHRWLKKPTIKTEDMIRLYEQGLSTNQIAKQLKVIGSTVVRRLKKVSISLRTSANYEGEKRYWRWKGADYIDPIIRKYNQRRLRKWSKAVRMRDKNVCQDCGKQERRMHAHHLVPIEACIGLPLEFDPSNGVTLCPKCHKRRHGYGKH